MECLGPAGLAMGCHCNQVLTCVHKCQKNVLNYSNVHNFQAQWPSRTLYAYCSNQLDFHSEHACQWPWCRPAASWKWLQMLSPKSVAEAWGRIWRLCFWAKAIINGMFSISSCTCPGIRSNPQIWSIFFVKSYCTNMQTSSLQTWWVVCAWR